MKPLTGIPFISHLKREREASTRLTHTAGPASHSIINTHMILIYTGGEGGAVYIHARIAQINNSWQRQGGCLTTAAAARPFLLVTKRTRTQKVWRQRCNVARHDRINPFGVQVFTCVLENVQRRIVSDRSTSQINAGSHVNDSTFDLRVQVPRTT